MTRSMFGWSLPPGCTQRMIDEAYGDDRPCECCGYDPAECICQECPVCNATGDPQCYDKKAHSRYHHMAYGKEQLIGQTRMKIAALQDEISAESQYIAWLEEKPDGWREDWEDK